jgi:hypothetical protein
MDLLPDEQKVLDRLAGDLGAQEPRLASMFGIFTRLTAQDGRPPEEDALLASQRLRPPSTQAGAAAGRHAHRPSRWLAGDQVRRRLVMLLLLAPLLAVTLVLCLTGIR